MKTNKIAIINLPSEEYKQIVQILRYQIIKGRITKSEIIPKEEIQTNESQVIEIKTKYATIPIELIPLKTISETNGKHFDGYVIDETTQQLEKCTEINVGELNIVIGNGKMLDWSIDNNIEYVDRRAVEDDDNCEGIYRVAEAIANSPWDMNMMNNSLGDDSLLFQMTNQLNSMKNETNTNEVSEKKENKEKEKKKEMTEEELEKQCDSFDKILKQVMGFKKRACEAKDLKERRKCAEEATMLLAQIMGGLDFSDESDEDDDFDFADFI